MYKYSALSLLIFFFASCKKEASIETESTSDQNKVQESNCKLKAIVYNWKELSFENDSLFYKDSTVLFCNNEGDIDSIHTYSIQNSDVPVFEERKRFVFENLGRTVTVFDLNHHDKFERQIEFNEEGLVIKLKDFENNEFTFSNGIGNYKEMDNYILKWNENVLTEIWPKAFPYKSFVHCDEQNIEYTSREDFKFLDHKLDIDYLKLAVIMSESHWSEMFKVFFNPDSYFSKLPLSYKLSVHECFKYKLEGSSIFSFNYNYKFKGDLISSILLKQEEVTHNYSTRRNYSEQVKFYYSD